MMSSDSVASQMMSRATGWLYAARHEYAGTKILPGLLTSRFVTVVEMSHRMQQIITKHGCVGGVCHKSMRAMLSLHPGRRNDEK